MIKEIERCWNSLDVYTRLSVLLILFGIILRFYLAFHTSIAGDSCWHLNVARFLAENWRIPLFENLGRDIFWAPPLFHILTAVSYSIITLLVKGDSLWKLNLISPLFGSLSLIVGYKILRFMFNKKIVFYSMIFLVFIPNHVFHSSVAYIDPTMTFFVLLSVFFVLKKHIVGSGIAFGLAMLTKYNAGFVFPLLVYIAYLNRKSCNKDFIKDVVVLTIIPVVIAGGWYLRNWVYLGNPVWHLGNNIFHGIPMYSENYQFSWWNFLNPYIPVDFFISLFGVPNGFIDNFKFIPFSHPYFIISVWLIGILLFFFPVIVGFLKLDWGQKRNKVMLVLLGVFLIQHLILIVDRGNFQSRRMMPAFLSLALFWGIGFNHLLNSKLFNKDLFKKGLIVLFCLIIIGMVSGEIIKNDVSNGLWDSYQPDFDWGEENIPVDALILGPPGQCAPFHIKREHFFPFVRGKSFEDANISSKLLIENGISYVYITKNHQLFSDSDYYYPVLCSELVGLDPVYDNNKDTKIYKLT